MPDPTLDGGPAPWETPGKRHTQKYGVGGPPGPAGQPYPQPAAPAHPPAPAYPSAYPPQPAPYPMPGYPGAPMQSYPPVYGAMPYMVSKPTSGLAIGSLVCAGLGFVLGLPWLVGIVLGALALRTTGPTGAHSGRGMAIAGTIVNSVCTLGVAAFVALIVVVAANIESERVQSNQVRADGTLIAQRVEMYYRDRGDLVSGGNCWIGGSRGARVNTALEVNHLAAPHELKLPIERYRLEVRGNSATIWYTSPEGNKSMAATFTGTHRHNPRPGQWHNYDEDD